ncbi:aminopeptidase Q-like [Chiloscyllium punctatum]|uniref:aminopeptidase Q-like n=1 Tax=Chiloscyllium punctatum TaxID=137246 RepID=UPI003B63DCC7
MGPKSNSGFYLSKKAAVFFAFLVLALLVILTVFVGLYAKLRAERTQEVTPATREPPSVSSSMQPGAERLGPWNHTRLPSNLQPIYYQLELWPKQVHPGKDHLYFLIGQANVTVMCLEETEVFLIHSRNLNYSGLSLTAGAHSPQLDPRPVPNIQEIWLEVSHDYLVIELDGKLVPGQQYILQSNYSGQLDEKLQGLFIIPDPEKEHQKPIIASLLEPTFARSVFPCFDEPAMKATFDIRLVNRPEFVAISNMPAIDVSERLDEDGKWKVTTFNTTVKMSTYTIAFVIFDYDYISTTYNDIEIRVWADKTAISNGEAEYALNITGPILAYFEKYYDVNYPLPKIDIVALPLYGPEAMENWGLLLFRKSSLLLDPKKESFKKLAITAVIAHELAHQWFGNLATIRWWNNLWLNEGFASYFENLEFSSEDHVKKWKHRYPIHLKYFVFQSEENIFSHSLSMKKEDIETFDEIMEMFSDTTYIKGASVIDMISHFMTEELFSKGLTSYLKAFSYSNAEADDVWNHLQMAIDSQDVIKLPTSIKSIMDTWTMQEGLPIITVNTTSGTVKQDYFGKSKENRNSNYSWFIPIFWMKNGSMQPLIWFDGESKTYPEIKRTTDEEWILLNINVSTLCRIVYDDSNWQQLILQLNKDPTVIPSSNRMQLICDAFDLEKIGNINIRTALSTTTYLAKEQDNDVWYAAFHYFSRLEKVIRTTYTFGLYKKYIFSRIVPFYYHQMKLMNEDFNNIHNSSVEKTIFLKTLNKLYLLDLKDLMDRATDLYSQLMSNPANNTIPSYARRHIYCEAIKAGSEKEWNFAWSLYQNSSQDDEVLLFAMGCSREPWILSRYLHYTLDELIVSEKHSYTVYQSVAENPIGWALAWNFLRANWNSINTNSTYYFELMTLLDTVSEGLLTDFGLQEFELFLNSTTDEEEWAHTVQQLIIDSRDLLNWNKKIHTEVHNWLSEHIPAN